MRVANANMKTEYKVGETTVREVVDRFDDNTMIEVYLGAECMPIPLERGYKGELKTTLNDKIFCRVTMKEDNVLEIVL